MGSIEELAASAAVIAKEIEKAISSFHRQLPEKKQLAYLQDTLNNLNQRWKSFEIIDDRIRSEYGDNLNHPYFANDYYNKIRKGYEALNEELINLIKHLEGSKGVTTAVEPKTTTIEIREGVKHQEEAVITTDTFKGIEKPTNNDPQRLVRKQLGIMAAIENLLKNIVHGNLRSTRYCETKYDKIKEYWDEIESINSTLWEYTDNLSKIGYNTETYFDLSVRTQDMLILLKEKIDETNNKSNTTQATTDEHESLRLPNLTLPRFDGNYLKWKQFYELFTQMVHNKNIASAQKLWYLKTNVTGEAEKLIRHLSITDGNYSIAWSLLKDRFENNRLIVNALIDKLMAQPALTAESASGLKALHDTTKECLLSLEDMGLAVLENWDPIIMHNLIKKLDANTHALYEQTLKTPRELQSVKGLLNFLEMRFQALEAFGQRTRRQQNPPKAAALMIHRTSELQCPMCKNSHAIYFCEKFKRLSPQERQIRAREFNLCLNCLKKGHNYNQCQSRNCLKCNKKHNTLLHFATNEQKELRSVDTHITRTHVSTHISTTKMQKQEREKELDKTRSKLSIKQEEAYNGYVLLGTATGLVRDFTGELVPCRILLDSGSQLNFITERLRRKLQLGNTQVNMNIFGIGESKFKLNKKLNVSLNSTNTNFSTELEAYVIKEITAQQPYQFINIKNWEIPTEIILADSEFNKPQKIDMLLGAELYGEIIKNGQIKLKEGLPILQNTTLGWIVLGRIADTEYKTPFCGITNIELEQQLQRFWEIEECPARNILSTLDKKCEDFFEATTTRNSKGRFVVNLPILGDPNLIGESKNMAFKRLLSIERKLVQDPLLKQEYDMFLEEYIELGHMREIKANQIQGPHCFLPHHYVLKPTSSTTKLRVVFDASAKTSNNLSLNDLMVSGPKIQDNIEFIMLRFRTKRYVFTSDINKMYRQILIAKEDRNLQLIMWRRCSSDPVKYYQLRTVTYGTKAAPYLAIKCLRNLAKTEQHNYPLAASVMKDFYVDDIVTGSNNLEEAKGIQRELIAMLKLGGFRLHKWCANHPSLVREVPPEDLEIQLNFAELEDEQVKTLGVIWHPITDLFAIKTNQKLRQDVTKRTILADMAQIFDPLGLINPVVVTSKIFIQRLWKLKLDWDDELPEKELQFWQKFRRELKDLDELRMPRYMFGDEVSINVQLHAFADASEKAYGTAIYLRSIDKHGKLTVRLLCAKSRVAPVKPTTLPRLELCAALLAAQLVRQVTENVQLAIKECWYWTDSQIVIAWIRGDASSLKTYVANRVATIQEITGIKSWSYVNTKQNPADLVSRGVSPSQLKGLKIWFEGPEFLKTQCSKWPRENVPIVRVPEEEKNDRFTFSVSNGIKYKPDNDEHPLYYIEHSNSFRKLHRVMAWIIRAVQHFKGNRSREQLLSVKELDNARTTIIRTMQLQSFNEELNLLKKNQQLHRSNKLAKLVPFLDASGLMRVGGRLQSADLNYGAKHPILLPAENFITKLILINLHNTHLHAGPQALLAISRQTYWIMQGRTITRSVVNNCLTCAKTRPRLQSQQMGNLPSTRVQKARPFCNTGVDFCGPMYTHFRIRGKHPQKTYIAVFCCFATKAIHLEVVSDLSTEGFLGALRRFVARRGHCENIYCDNGRNFVGARRQLEEVANMLQSDSARRKIVNFVGDKRIQFHFIPPRSPHFGGLWEAAVKSTKTLLQKTIASAAITYEELCTATSEVEAILNSRPLTVLSNDPNDLMALTPAHFLIGEPLTTTIESNHVENKMSLLSRWQLVSYIKNEFWRRWSSEYLSELQKRAKWIKAYPNMKPGTLVTIKDENLPPAKWSMGRVVESFPGPDGKVRVVDVKTATGIYRRAIHLLSPLPVETEEPSSTKGITYEDISDEAKAKKRKGGSLKANVAKVLLLATLVLPMYSSSYALNISLANQDSMTGKSIEITKFQHSAGIYFDRIGRSYLASSYWNIMIYYDLTEYKATINSIEQILLQLIRLSGFIEHNQSYQQIIKQYANKIEQIKSNNAMLESPRRQRKNRALLNIVGTIAHKLFGVLDEEYAAQMETTIDMVKDNENYLHELIKNQTTILDSTMNIIKKTEEDRLNLTSEIKAGLKQQYDRLTNMNAEMQSQKGIQAFNTLAILTNSLISEVELMQEMVLQVIIDIEHGKMNPLIITAQQLKRQISLIRENLPPNLQLPIANKQISLSSLYKLMSMRYQIKNNYVLFTANLPLVRVTEFDLYHLIPLPTLLNETHVSITPELDFIMSNIYKDNFYLLSYEEYKHCTELVTGEYICDEHRALINKLENVKHCEISLFLHEEATANCEVRISKPARIWIRLQATNRWLFSLDQNYTVHIVCNQRYITTVMEGSGVLTLQPGCTLKNEDLTISTGSILHTKGANQSFQPVINLTMYDIRRKAWNNTVVIQSINHTEEIRRIKDNIISLSKQQGNLKDIKKHNVHQLTVGYSSIAGLLIIIGFFAVRWCCKKTARVNLQRNIPQPAPRTV